MLLRPQVEVHGGALGRKGNGVPQETVAVAVEGGPPSESPSGDEESLPHETSAGESGGLALEISEIVIEDGSIRLQREGAEGASISVEGLNLRLQDLTFNPKAISLIHALSASGRLGIDTLSLDTTEVREVNGELQLDNGTFEGQDFAFRTDQGRFRADLAVDFNQIPFGYTLALRGDPLDVNGIAGSTDGGFGPGVLEFDAEGYGTDSKGIKGKGVLRLAEGKLPSSPALVGVENALGRGTSLVGASVQSHRCALPYRKQPVNAFEFPVGDTAGGARSERNR